MKFEEVNDFSFDTDAEELCLSFANTADWHASEHPVEGLKDYSDLLDWGIVTGSLTRERAEHLALVAGRAPDAAYSTLQKAIGLRETIYRIFSAVANHQSVAEEDMNILNDFISQTFTFMRVSDSGTSFDLSWEEKTDALDQVLWPVIHSAAELLTSGQLDRVGQCADDRGCGWLFYDHSRNRSRRWCSMETCGNRAKVQRHFEKKKSAR
jgi:predicted RNA-binding Zn ribbon-like protein